MEKKKKNFNVLTTTHYSGFRIMPKHLLRGRPRIKIVCTVSLKKKGIEKRNALLKQTNTENYKHRLIDKIANKIHYTYYTTLKRKQW